MNPLKNITIKPIGILVALLATAVMLSTFGVIELDLIDFGSQPLAEPPLPVYTVQDSLVKVVNRTPGVTRCGFGVAVQYQGAKFILTSRMIFHSGLGDVTVNDLPASVIAEDETWELVALKCPSEPAQWLHLDNQEIEGTFKVVADGTTLVVKGRSVRSPKSPRSADRQWALLRGVCDPCTGAPVFIDDALVGLVIGTSRSNSDEVIAASKSLLIKLAEQVAGDE